MRPATHLLPPFILLVLLFVMPVIGADSSNFIPFSSEKKESAEGNFCHCISPGFEIRLNREACCTSSDCLGSRKCHFMGSTQNSICDGRDNCTCMDRGQTCEIKDNCDAGESCVAVNTADNSPKFCIGNRAKEISNVTESLCQRCDALDIMDGGVSRDACCIDTQCKGKRTCRQIKATPDRSCVEQDEKCECIDFLKPPCESDDECDDRERCWKPYGTDSLAFCTSRERMNAVCKLQPDLCAPRGACKSDDDCDALDNEICFTPIGNDRSSSFCIRRTRLAKLCEDHEEFCLEASPLSEVGEGSCIDGNVLREHGVQGVFKGDRLGWVLCDKQGSCASEGHVVVWQGQAMSMKTYCSTTSCERKVISVNSPRGWGVRLQSRTEGLRYTSVAGRWATALEERVLGSLVRLGA